MNNYDAGFDSAVNGSNYDNCHFSRFGSIEKTREWERGRAAGERSSSVPPRTPEPDGQPESTIQPKEP